MKLPRNAATHARRSVLTDVLTLERLVTGPLVHIVYWCGLGIVVLGGFAVIGAGVGGALREGGLQGWLLAIPAAVAGLLVVVALGVIWRSFCEFYVVIVRLGEDLHALRRATEAEAEAAAPPPQRQAGVAGQPTLPL
jgi:hypothetical protein